MRTWSLPQFGRDHLRLEDRPSPAPGPGEVSVKVRAASLNYRDLLVVSGKYNPRMPLPRVPGSDASGEVTAIGDGVAPFQIGDRVCGTFFQDWIDGPITEAAAKSALGGATDGAFAEEVLFAERGLVTMPSHLSFEEAACLPCAALTAWNALTGAFDPAGKTVLVQGTGGVSLFALQFAVALGAKVFISSGNDEKLRKALNLGATAGVNYRTTPDWEKWVRQQTGNAGVDLVVEVGGAGTLEKSVKSLRHGGQIALIGVLAGGSGFDPLPLMMKAATLRGIFVGSRTQFIAMNTFLEQNTIHPILDRVFRFEELPAALEYLESAKHFGKVVLNTTQASRPGLG